MIKFIKKWLNAEKLNTEIKKLENFRQEKKKEISRLKQESDNLKIEISEMKNSLQNYKNDMFEFKNEVDEFRKILNNKNGYE